MSASFLALGDSYTIGEGVAEQDRWPVQLASRLVVAGVRVQAPRIVARTGWTTGELLDAMAAEHISGRFDLVTLMVGVNDQYRGHGLVRYRDDFASLLRAALSLSKLPGRLIVLSVPDWGITPFARGRDRPAISHEIDNFNAVARELATTAGARFLDVTTISRMASGDVALLTADELHPSAAMYEMWVDALLPVATDALTAS